MEILNILDNDCSSVGGGSCTHIQSTHNDSRLRIARLRQKVLLKDRFTRSKDYPSEVTGPSGYCKSPFVVSGATTCEVSVRLRCHRWWGWQRGRTWQLAQVVWPGFATLSGSRRAHFHLCYPLVLLHARSLVYFRKINQTGPRRNTLQLFQYAWLKNQYLQSFTQPWRLKRFLLSFSMGTTWPDQVHLLTARLNSVRC